MLVRFLLILFLFNNFYYSITIIRFLFNLVEEIKAETPYKIILRGWSSNALDIAVSAKVHLTNNPIMDITGFRFQIIQKDVFTANSGSWYGSEFKEFAVAETYHTVDCWYNFLDSSGITQRRGNQRLVGG